MSFLIVTCCFTEYMCACCLRSQTGKQHRYFAVIVGLFAAVKDQSFDCSITDKSAIVSGVT